MAKSKFSKQSKPIKLVAKRQSELEKSKGNPTGDKLSVICEDKWVEIEVYAVKRSLLRLNPNNGRFGSGKDRLIKLRRNAGIKNPAVFVMDDFREPNPKDRNEKFYDPDTEEQPMGGDVNQIRNMIKGIQPPDPEKVTKYKELKKSMKDHQKRVASSNGQKDPGIVLADGTYVNANRRDCVLEDFWQASGKSVGITQNFNSLTLQFAVQRQHSVMF